MTKTAIILPTALIRTINGGPDRNLCLNQLIAGFISISKLVKKYPDILDLYWIDNTIQPKIQYDNGLISIVDSLPNLQNKKLFFENYYNPDGSVNKGCGIIALWRKILPEIINKEYDFIIHFEPRQEIKNYSFFETFIKKPDIYFKAMRRQPDVRVWRKYFPPYVKREIWTGLFSCSPQILSAYTNEKISIGLDRLAENKFHLEGNLYNYLKKNNIQFKSLPNLCLYWHDNIQNLHVSI